MVPVLFRVERVAKAGQEQAYRIPTLLESEVDELTLSVGRKTIAFLRLLNETGK